MISNAKDYYKEKNLEIEQLLTAIGHAKELVKPCKERPTHHGYYALKRMAEGRTPRLNLPWKSIDNQALPDNIRTVSTRTIDIAYRFHQTRPRLAETDIGSDSESD